MGDAPEDIAHAKFSVPEWEEKGKKSFRKIFGLF